MSKPPVNIPIVRFADAILTIRDERVILDADLSLLYGVETRALIQAVKRNDRRFPMDFMFQLTREEFDTLRSRIVISKGRGGRRHLPYASKIVFDAIRQLMNPTRPGAEPIGFRSKALKK